MKDVYQAIGFFVVVFCGVALALCLLMAFIGTADYVITEFNWWRRRRAVRKADRAREAASAGERRPVR